MKKNIILFLILFFIKYLILIAQWQPLSLPVQNPDDVGSIECFVLKDENIFVGTSGAGVFKSTNNGDTWLEVNNGLTTYNIKSLIVSGEILIAGTITQDGWGQGRIFVSTNNGASWFLKNNNSPSEYIHSFAVKGSNIFAGTYDGVYLSKDNCETWVLKNNGLTQKTVISLIVKGSNIFAGTFNRVYLSSDNGDNWDYVGNGISSPFIYSLAVMGDNIFAGTSGKGIFVSSDNGDSWFERNNGFTQFVVASLCTSGNYLFAGTESGAVFVTDNYGLNWTKNSDGLQDDDYIQALIADDDFLYAGASFSNYVYRKPLSEIVVSLNDEKKVIPPEFKLYQNFPNPFNPTTTIEYSIPTVASGFNKVQLKTYDLLGREVMVLVNENQTQGNYKIQFDAQSLPSGIYFYRLQSGSFTEIKKMILIK